ncbi:hypothetical protein OSTOST_00289 [Ostertagia ostertagi]
MVLRKDRGKPIKPADDLAHQPSMHVQQLDTSIGLEPPQMAKMETRGSQLPPDLDEWDLSELMEMVKKMKWKSMGHAQEGSMVSGLDGVIRIQVAQMIDSSTAWIISTVNTYRTRALPIVPAPPRNGVVFYESDFEVQPKW